MAFFFDPNHLLGGHVDDSLNQFDSHGAAVGGTDFDGHHAIHHDANHNLVGTSDQHPDGLGVKVSATEVSNAITALMPQAKAFLNRPLGGRKWIYLYVDGTFFSVKRRTTEKEPVLVVLGVDEHGFKSVLAMVVGDKDTAWEKAGSRRGLWVRS